MALAMSRSQLTAAVLLVCALALGGCGDDDVYRTDRPVLRLTLDEYRIVPQNVVVKPGRTAREYRLVCTIANHDDLGQYGELEAKK
jgi:hypothetical protein